MPTTKSRHCKTSTRTMSTANVDTAKNEMFEHYEKVICLASFSSSPSLSPASSPLLFTLIFTFILNLLLSMFSDVDILPYRHSALSTYFCRDFHCRHISVDILPLSRWTQCWHEWLIWDKMANNVIMRHVCHRSEQRSWTKCSCGWLICDVIANGVIVRHTCLRGECHNRTDCL